MSLPRMYGWSDLYILEVIRTHLWVQCAIGIYQNKQISTVETVFEINFNKHSSSGLK